MTYSSPKTVRMHLGLCEYYPRISKSLPRRREDEYYMVQHDDGPYSEYLLKKIKGEWTRIGNQAFLIDPAFIKATGEAIEEGIEC